MKRPRALDLFCCAGGAAKGLFDAGFDVVGWDIRPQPRYPFEFHQGDALTASTAGFDFIWASPPCQAHTAMKTMHNAKPHLDFIPATRAKLLASGLPYCIENVMGAPLLSPFTLCGTMFGLGVEDADLQRHRIFEVNYPVGELPTCRHGARATIGIYGGHVRNRKPRTIGVYGEGARDSRRKFDKGVPDFTSEQGREAMGISWMTIAELSQAIPPAYSEFIGRAAMKTVLSASAMIG
jgi:DNA (cytosine-5)-methyltransferase 1